MSQNPIVIDLRSEQKKFNDIQIERQMMIEAAKNNLLLKIAEGKINAANANYIIDNMIEFDSKTKLLNESEFV